MNSFLHDDSDIIENLSGITADVSFIWENISENQADDSKV